MYTYGWFTLPAETDTATWNNYTVIKKKNCINKYEFTLIGTPALNEW